MKINENDQLGKITPQTIELSKLEKDTGLRLPSCPFTLSLGYINLKKKIFGDQFQSPYPVISPRALEWVLTLCYLTWQGLFWAALNWSQMERYGALSLIQAVRERYFGISWSTVFAVVVFVCITTRIISGLQSRPDRDSKSQTVRVAPYWFPWIGHGPAFLWNHVTFFARARLVFYYIVLLRCLLTRL